MQVSTLNAPVKFSETNGKSNIYFCWGIKSQMDKRCDDSDIWLKKYLAIDIDIRNDHYLATWEVISQEDMRKVFGEIVVRLSLKWYDDYCALVDSWNWLHIYWTGKEREFERSVYQNWIKQLQSNINHIIKDLWFVCDPACTNLSRIMRLPWTINPRKKETKLIKYDLWPTEAEILWFEDKDSETFDMLEQLADMYKEEEAKEKKEKVEAKREIKGTYKKSDDMWTEINSIPVQEIAEYVRWVTATQDDGEVITLKEPHKNMWAYVYKPYNVVYNQWSSLIKTTRTTFTPFELICFEMMDWDRKATIDWFASKYSINTSMKLTEQTEIETRDFEIQWYLFPDDIFDDTFDCVMSGELVTIVAESNTGKTTFAMDMIARNIKRGKKCLYINLEFGIEQVATNNWLFMNWKRKRNITDLDPLSPEEQKKLNAYVKNYLWNFDYANKPWWIDLDDLVQMILDKNKEWYWFIILDTFSMINGNSDENAYSNQNKAMIKLQELCQKTWVTIVQLHHTNKSWVMEWSKKILNLSNTLITMTMETDDYDDVRYTKAILTKDKFTKKTEVNFRRENRERIIYNP